MVESYRMLFLLMVSLASFGNLVWAAPDPEPQNWFSSLFGGNSIEPTGENLVKVIEEGSLETVKDLVERGANVNYAEGRPLVEAARHGKIEIVRYLLGAGANANGTNEQRFHYGLPLQHAAGGNHLEIMDMLLAAGASAATPDRSNNILDRAAENGHVEAVKKLLDAGADPNLSEAYSLLLAAKKGHLDVVKAYIAAGVDLNAHGGWVLNSAAEEGHLEVVKTLIDAPSFNTSLIHKALNRAAGGGKLDVVNFLLTKGADPNKSSALKSAAEDGFLETVRTLLNAGATITYDDDNGSPLHYAAMNGHPDVVALLVEYGADINRTLKRDFWFDLGSASGSYYGNGWTVMHTAAKFGYPIMQELIALGAGIDPQDSRGQTPVQVAAFYGKTQVTKTMLKFCADLSIQNNEGKTALDLAREVSLKNTSSDPLDIESHKNFLKMVMSEKISSAPNNKQSTDKLKREFQALIEANVTLKEQIGKDLPDGIEIENALHFIFKERARKEMVNIIEDNYCNVFEKNGLISLGTEYVAKCSCVPGQGPKMIFTPLQEANLCSKVSAEEPVAKAA